jgi:hypothetical protein
MLIKFAVRNYRGFQERIEWDLSHPSSYEFNQHAIKDGVVKNGIVYGPNGSGKTNLGLAVFDIVNHLTQKFKKADYYTNFVYAGHTNSPVEFEYTFQFGEQMVCYNYAKDKDGKLLAERLEVDGTPIFQREGTTLNLSDEFPMEAGFKETLTQNDNHVSIVNVLLTSYPLKSDHYLIQLRHFVEGMLWFRNLDIREFIGLDSNVYALDEYIIKNHLVADFSAFLTAVSGQNFDFASPQQNDKTLFCKYGDEKVAFDMIASTGTHALMLLYFWIQKMNSATLVFIDEFDAFYHFELSYEVCQRLFHMDCQVYMSSHNTYLMTNDLLRPDCNFILDKNAIKPLCECTDKELRFGHNIEKLYRGKTFKI